MPDHTRRHRNERRAEEERIRREQQQRTSLGDILTGRERIVPTPLPPRANIFGPGGILPTQPPVERAPYTGLDWTQNILPFLGNVLGGAGNVLGGAASAVGETWNPFIEFLKNNWMEFQPVWPPAGSSYRGGSFQPLDASLIDPITGANFRNFANVVGGGVPASVIDPITGANLTSFAGGGAGVDVPEAGGQARSLQEIVNQIPGSGQDGTTPITEEMILGWTSANDIMDLYDQGFMTIEELQNYVYLWYLNPLDEKTGEASWSDRASYDGANETHKNYITDYIDRILAWRYASDDEKPDTSLEELEALYGEKGFTELNYLNPETGEIEPFWKDAVPFSGDAPEQTEMQRRRQTWAEQEVERYGFENVFRQFLASQPATGLGMYGQRAREAQFDPLLASFRAQPITFAGDKEYFQAPLFQEFLAGGGQAMGPGQYTQRLTDIGNLFGEEDPTWRQIAEMAPFEGNLDAFNAWIQPFMGSLSPHYRKGMMAAAQADYDKFQGTTPEKSYMQHIAERGGFFV